MISHRPLGGALALGVALLILPACQQPSTQARVVDQWAQRMDLMGLVPIIPPQEDIKVGDVYVYSVDPHEALTLDDRRNAARLIASTTRWSSLPVLPNLETEYTNRPAWPRTPDAFLQPTPQLDQWAEPESADNRSIFAGNEVPTRLRIVNLESLTSTAFSAQDLEAVIPTEIAPLISGTADSRSIAVNFRIGSAESYGLSMEAILALLCEAGGQGPTGYRVRAPYRNNLNFAADLQGRVWMTVTTEVVYFRSADITVRPANANLGDDQVSSEQLMQAAQAMQEADSQAAQPAVAAEGDEPAPPPSSSGASEDTKRIVGAALDPTYAAFVRASAINQVLEETDADDAPGGLVRFLSVTNEAVSIRKVWPRALAIGVRGISLQVDAASGDIIEVQPLMWPVSVSTQLAK